MKVFYNGKEREKVEVCPGVVVNGSAYLVQCSVTKEWCYVNEDRFDSLVARYGSQEDLGRKYVSRKGKKQRDLA